MIMLKPNGPRIALTGSDAEVPPLPPSEEPAVPAAEDNRQARPAAADRAADSEREAHRSERDRDRAHSRKHEEQRHRERDHKREREADSHSHRYVVSQRFAPIVHPGHFGKRRFL